jgi:hypothetical protein
MYVWRRVKNYNAFIIAQFHSASWYFLAHTTNQRMSSIPETSLNFPTHELELYATSTLKVFIVRVWLPLRDNIDVQHQKTVRFSSHPAWHKFQFSCRPHNGALGGFPKHDRHWSAFTCSYRVYVCILPLILIPIVGSATYYVRNFKKSIFCLLVEYIKKILHSCPLDFF